MRKLCLTLIATIAGAGIAHGADLPTAYPAYKAPAMAPLLYDWSGLYVGANFGYGFGRATGDISGAGGGSSSISQDLPGVLGGVQVGYNWQSGHWVSGLESDIQFSAQENSNTTACATASCTRNDSMPWFGTTRARFGYAANRWLIYATAGVAYGEAESEITVSSGGASATGSKSDIRAGLALGGGVEVGLTRHWTARLDYLYLDTGDIDNTATLAGVGTINGTARLHNNVVRGAINYRF